MSKSCDSFDNRIQSLYEYVIVNGNRIKEKDFGIPTCYTYIFDVEEIDGIYYIMVRGLYEGVAPDIVVFYDIIVVDIDNAKIYCEKWKEICLNRIFKEFHSGFINLDDSDAINSDHIYYIELKLNYWKRIKEIKNNVNLEDYR